VAAPSPLIDAIDMMADVREAAAAAESNKSPSHVPAENVGVVKIGQTSLHNPGGRSSWIGL
jgi:type II protein arginine methyltransferase